MIEIEPEVPRQARIVFMAGGGVILFALVMVILLMGRSPEPSHVMDNDPEPPIQQRYNVDPLRVRPSTADGIGGSTGPRSLPPTTRPTTQPATRPTTRPATSPATNPAVRATTFDNTRP